MRSRRTLGGQAYVSDYVTFTEVSVNDSASNSGKAEFDTTLIRPFFGVAGDEDEGEVTSAEYTSKDISATIFAS
jgi:hypothetical protein